MEYEKPMLRGVNFDAAQGACLDGSSATATDICEGGAGDNGTCVGGTGALDGVVGGACTDGTSAWNAVVPSCNEGTTAINEFGTDACGSGVTPSTDTCGSGSSAAPW